MEDQMEEESERINWTMQDFRMVSFVALGNGLWLGFLVWLVLGLWLDILSFIPIWITATLLSWILAIYRQARVIRMRESMD